MQNTKQTVLIVGLMAGRRQVGLLLGVSHGGSMMDIISSIKTTHSPGQHPLSTINSMALRNFYGPSMASFKLQTEIYFLNRGWKV